LAALRLHAAAGPLLVALDDLQWLDQSSTDCVEFAARRLAERDVRFLATRRAGTEPILERAIRPANLQVLELSALSFGAMNRLLQDRLGLDLPRRIVRQLHDVSRGNPLFALELARPLAGREAGTLITDLPLPRIVDDALFGCAPAPGGHRLGISGISLPVGFPHLFVMQEYLVEVYEAPAMWEVHPSPEDVASTAELLTSEGRPVRLVRSFYLPEDEVRFFLFEAESPDDVAVTATLAGLHFQRVRGVDTHLVGSATG
jgi:hypothetical protein